MSLRSKFFGSVTPLQAGVVGAVLAGVLALAPKLSQEDAEMTQPAPEATSIAFHNASLTKDHIQFSYVGSVPDDPKAESDETVQLATIDRIDNVVGKMSLGDLGNQSCHQDHGDIEKTVAREIERQIPGTHITQVEAPGALKMQLAKICP